MSIEKVNPWIALATNIGVIIGLILLMIEISQNTRALRQQSEFSNVGEWTNVTRLVADSPDLASILMRGDENLLDLTGEEQVRYFNYMASVTLVTELSYNSVRSRAYAYDPRAYDEYIVSIYTTPGGRFFWNSSRQFVSDDFADHVNGLLAAHDEANEANPE